MFLTKHNLSYDPGADAQAVADEKNASESEIARLEMDLIGWQVIMSSECMGVVAGAAEGFLRTYRQLQIKRTDAMHMVIRHEGIRHRMDSDEYKEMVRLYNF